MAPGDAFWPPKAYTESTSAPMMPMKASRATAARRWVSIRLVAGVTLPDDDERLGSLSWTLPTARVKELPAASFALPAVAVTAAAPAVTPSASGIGDLSGAPARGSAGRTGTSVRCLNVAPTSAASNAKAPSEPVPSAAVNRAWMCSIADCGCRVTRASFRVSVPIRPTTLRDTRHSESPTLNSPRQTSGSRPSLGMPRSPLGSGSVDSRAWRMR